MLITKCDRFVTTALLNPLLKIHQKGRITAETKASSMRFHKLSSKNSCNLSRGFSLTEILIVVVIIGILAALIVPRFVGVREKTEAAGAINTLGALRRTNLAHFDRNGAYIELSIQCPADPTQPNPYQALGLDLSTDCPSPKWLYQMTNDPTTTTIQITGPGPACQIVPGTAIAIRLNMGAIVLRPDGIWCGSDKFAPGQPYDISGRLDKYSQTNPA